MYCSLTCLTCLFWSHAIAEVGYFGGQQIVSAPLQPTTMLPAFFFIPVNLFLDVHVAHCACYLLQEPARSTPASVPLACPWLRSDAAWATCTLRERFIRARKRPTSAWLEEDARHTVVWLVQGYGCRHWHMIKNKKKIRRHVLLYSKQMPLFDGPPSLIVSRVRRLRYPLVIEHARTEH